MDDRRSHSTRRDFLKTAALGAAAASLAPGAAFGWGKSGTAVAAPFKLKYAPSIGAFEGHAGKNPVDQIKFMADQGFGAWFDTA